MSKWIKLTSDRPVLILELNIEVTNHVAIFWSSLVPVKCESESFAKFPQEVEVNPGKSLLVSPL